MSATLVVAGAGHAAGQVVASLKQHEYDGHIVLIGEEPWLPYQRPPLSKKFLAGELPAERLHFKPQNFYDDDRIEVRLETRIAAVDRELKQLTTADKQQIHYDKLVFATGSRVRKLSLAGSDLAGVYYLRNIDDVDRIRAEVGPGKRVVIVGAGYIGLEVAAVMAGLGLDVTVVELADRVMSRVVSEPVSEFYQQEHHKNGVKLLLGTGLTALLGNGRIKGVATSDGLEIPADFVIVGVGILANTELAADAGLTINNGIVVDDRCQTQDPDIYAVGDCTSHPSAIYGRHVRLESVHNALEQAKTAAANICGQDSHYNQVPWFWSDQYDLKLQIAGLSTGYDEIVLRGDPATRAFSCLYLRDRALLAVDAINAPRDFVQSKALIAARAEIAIDDLANTGKPLAKNK